MSTVICKQCGKENKSHFKFCLGCGSELTKDNVILKPEPTMPPSVIPPPDSSVLGHFNLNEVANAPTMAAMPGSELAAELAKQGINIPEVTNAPAMAPPPASAPAMAPPPASAPAMAPPPASAPAMAPPPASAPAMAPPPASAPAMAPPPASAPAMAPPPPAVTPQRNITPPPVVADDASELPFSSKSNFESASTVVSEDAYPVSTDTSPSKPTEEPNKPHDKILVCSNCGAQIPSGFKFCGSCGTPIENISPESIPPLDVGDTIAASVPLKQPEPVAKLIVQKPDGSLDEVLELMEGVTIIGRTTHTVFENDYYMSPEHVKISIQHGLIQVEDLNTLNGTYFRIKQEELLSEHDIIRIGTEVLRYRELPTPSPSEDGTMILGSPNVDAWGRLELITGKNVPGKAFVLSGERIKIGRDDEDNDISFPDDGYVSGEHLELNRLDKETYLVDLNSSNGTYLKINKVKEIEPGTPILMGFQLYLVQLI